MPKRKKPDLMKRTRAAVAYCNTRPDDEATQLAAFMDLFHPGHEKTAEIVRAKRAERSR